VLFKNQSVLLLLVSIQSVNLSYTPVPQRIKPAGFLMTCNKKIQPKLYAGFCESRRLPTLEHGRETVH